MISIYPTQGISLRGSYTPRAIVGGKVIVGTPIRGQRLDFVDNECDCPPNWLEFDDDEGGKRGLKHTEGYMGDFVEKSKLVADLKIGKQWAINFLERMNRRRMVVTPALGEVDRADMIKE